MTERIIAVYQYRNLSNQVVHETLRYFPKDFRQRRPDGAGGYIWNLQDIEPVLYRLPEITKAIAQGIPLFLCEGEKDADNLVKLGFEATTAAMGCGKWRQSYTETLKGALCLICPDNDAAGWAHALNVLEEIYYDAECCKIIRLPGHGKDVSDWISAGGTAEALRDLADNEPVCMPLSARRFYSAQLKAMSPAELLAEIERLKTAPLRETPKAQLVEYQLKFIQETLNHKLRKRGGIDLSYATA
jgi:DNA primase